jgi:hypothetical protein
VRKIARMLSYKATSVLAFISGSEYSRKVLRMLLGKWDVLELLWNTTDRPFARFLSLRGHLTSKYKDYYLEVNQ